MNIVVCVSLARHPKSGRLMLAPNDARALAVATTMCDKPTLVHVGPSGHDWALRQYLGLGFPEVHRIEPNGDQDVAGLLAGFIRQRGGCDWVLCGAKAQGQDDSGLVPYLVADALGFGVIEQVMTASVSRDAIEVTQFLPKGQRRTLSRPGPQLLVVSENAPLTLEYVARRARSGQVLSATATPLPISDTALAWQQEPAKPGHRRLTIKSNRSGWDRFSQRMAVTGGGGEVIRDDPNGGCEQVLTLLRSKGLIR